MLDAQLLRISCIPVAFLPGEYKELAREAVTQGDDVARRVVLHIEDAVDKDHVRAVTLLQPLDKFGEGLSVQ